MICRILNREKTVTSHILLLAFPFLIMAALAMNADTAIAQNGEPEIGVRGFLDEDGDGFNDLMPDFDGDGVPNPIDPDFRRDHHADSAGMHRDMHARNDSTGTMRGSMMGSGFMFMDRHGEPGMFGPGDSTMHGGMMGDSSGHHGGGGGHGGWPPPDTGGYMGGGGMGGPGPNRSTDPNEKEKEIRNTPGTNGATNRLAVPLRDIPEGKGKNQ